MEHITIQHASSASSGRQRQLWPMRLLCLLILTTSLALLGCPGDDDNDPPVAVNDEQTIAADSGALNIAVLTNDTDADDDDLTVAIVTPPDNGTAVRNDDNTITYTPNADFSGTDTFVYSVNDGEDTATATVIITVTEEDVSGAVFAMTNVLNNNEIVVFRRANDGTLTPLQRIATGGGGSGVQLDPTDSLGSQGGLALNATNTLLFAVNTESLAEDPVDNVDVGDCEIGSITSFTVAADGQLTRVGTVPSGGLFPVSLAVRGNILYVLNAGGPGLNPVCNIMPNITAFTIDQNGALAPLANSTQTVNPGTSPGTALNCDPGGGPFPTDEFRCGLNPPAFPRSPGQIGVTPNGNFVVVTVKGTNSILTYPLDQNGIPGAVVTRQAPGPQQPTFFGFGFDNAGNLIVSEPFGASATIPAPTASAVSSYSINGNGTLTPIANSAEPGVPSGEGTACWVALDPDREFAYIGNNLSSSISAYTVGANGAVTLLQADAAAAALPNDLATVRSNGNSFLYVLNSGDGTVGAYRIDANGSLTEIDRAGGLPVDAGAQGLAAF